MLVVVTYLKKLLTIDARFGPLLMQYYKQILPSLNSFLMRRTRGPLTGLKRNLKPAGELNKDAASLQTEIEDLLTLMEKTAGKVHLV